MTDLHVVTMDVRDGRLGRQVVHDERSRGYAAKRPVNTATWKTRIIPIYDPRPNPKQKIGNCTGADKAMAFNSKGNRVKGRVLTMDDADKMYALATTLDPFAGSWPPVDTGSSGLAACKSAQKLGYGLEYRWIFGGADEVVQNIVDGNTVGVGTWWTEDGFNPKPNKGKNSGQKIHMTGRKAGGHQYRVRGYHEGRDQLLLRCWWGIFRDVWMDRLEFNDLLLDDGDANVQKAARADG